MIATLTIALMLAQSPEPLSSHVVTNIRTSLRGAKSAAVVTVLAGAPEGRVKLKVDEAVLGELPAELEVTAAAFNKRDVVEGTRLLVFFRAAHVPTGHYELVWENKVREYPLETYVAHVKALAAKPAPRAKVAPASAPVSDAGSKVHAGS